MTENNKCVICGKEIPMNDSDGEGPYLSEKADVLMLGRITMAFMSDMGFSVEDWEQNLERGIMHGACFDDWVHPHGCRKCHIQADILSDRGYCQQCEVDFQKVDNHCVFEAACINHNEKCDERESPPKCFSDEPIEKLRAVIKSEGDYWKVVDGKYINHRVNSPEPSDAPVQPKSTWEWYKCTECGIEAWVSDGDGVPLCPKCLGTTFMEKKIPEDKRIITEKYGVAKAMIRWGGSFVKNLGYALLCADISNSIKIAGTFPEYWKKYLQMWNEDQKSKVDGETQTEVC